MTTDSTGTGVDLKGDAKKDVVPPSEESQGKPGDDFVKKSQMIAALNSATAKTETALAEAAALRREVEALKKPAQKAPTRAELRQFVESGQLTQDKADEIWDKHLLESAKAGAVIEVTKTLAQQDRERIVATQLSGYKELVPDAWVAGSPERLKAEKEFAHLVGLGYPQTQDTEAAALRAAFGDLEILRASKSARGGPADAHVEIGGNRPDGERKSTDVLKNLAPRQKEFYEAQIKSGRYKGWDEVKAELEFKPRARA